MNYDTMGVHELLGKYAEWANERITTHWEHQIDREVIVPDQDLMLIGPKGEAIESALRKAVIGEASVETCEWVESEEGVWDTSCEETFVFEEGDPEENNSHFCCYCGKPIKVVPFVYSTEEETP